MRGASRRCASRPAAIPPDAIPSPRSASSTQAAGKRYLIDATPDFAGADGGARRASRRDPPDARAHRALSRPRSARPRGPRSEEGPGLLHAVDGELPAEQQALEPPRHAREHRDAPRNPAGRRICPHARPPRHRLPRAAPRRGFRHGRVPGSRTGKASCSGFTTSTEAGKSGIASSRTFSPTRRSRRSSTAPSSPPTSCLAARSPRSASPACRKRMALRRGGHAGGAPHRVRPPQPHEPAPLGCNGHPRNRGERVLRRPRRTGRRLPRAGGKIAPPWPPRSPSPLPSCPWRGTTAHHRGGWPKDTGERS